MLGGRVTIREIWRAGKLDQYGRKSWNLRGHVVPAVFFLGESRLLNLDGEQTDVAGRLEVPCDIDINQADVLTLEDDLDQYEVFAVDKNPGIDGETKAQSALITKLKRRLTIP